MRAIHPFPARMAPETVSKWLEALPKGSRVLDPMCGSGMVIRHATEMGHSAIGYDVDPLAVLMSRVWSRSGSHTALATYAQRVVKSAERRKTTPQRLPWIAECNETRKFVEFWFAEPQRNELSRLAAAIDSMSFDLPSWAVDALYLAMSRIIVTKQAGASLAWDVSHSRPHRKIMKNDFSTLPKFIESAERLAVILDETPLPKTAMVRQLDCRDLSRIHAGSIDALVTSPPYLNAIDYLRGHKLSLVWMGYTIPELRAIRAKSVGTERGGERNGSDQNFLQSLKGEVLSFSSLPSRFQAIVLKYAQDADKSLQQFRRVIARSGRLILVLADSTLRGIDVPNSQIFSWLAHVNGFRLLTSEHREIAPNHRYLPIRSQNLALSRRMKHETVQVYSITS